MLNKLGFAVATMVCFSWIAFADGVPPRVVLISVDGLRPDAITPDVAPRMSALRDAGLHAELAINDLPSATLPNHASMLTGLSGDVHGLIADFEIPGSISDPTVFEYLSQAGLRSSFFASKTKLKYLAPRQFLVTFDIEDPEPLADRVVAEITATGPDFIFVHFRDPDSTGHSFGWMSPEYLDAVSRMDELVGAIADALHADFSRASFLILTSDHGGEGLNHFLNTPADREIPWIVVGPEVPAGGVLPGMISTVDTTPTILWLLGVDTPPGLSGQARTSILSSSPGAADERLPVPPVGIPCLLLAVPGFAGVAWFLRPRR